MLNWDDIDLPEGYTKEDMLEKIEYVSTMKAWDNYIPNNGLLALEDLKQEIHLKCLKAVSRFDAKKIKDEKQIIRFFSTCADNHVRDLNRKHHYYHIFPCKKCPLACSTGSDYNESIAGKNGCTKYDNKLHCKDFSKYINLKSKKSSLGQSATGAISNDMAFAKLSDGDEANNQIELDEFIKKNVGKSTYQAYKKLVDNYYDMSRLNDEESTLLRKALGRLYDTGDLDV